MSDATQRLLDAWRGEVQARAQYEILAGRMKDPRRAEIIRKIAEAEGRHRERVEKRLHELGVTLPGEDSARLSWMQRLQAQLAPVDVVIGRMEAAERSLDEIQAAHATDPRASTAQSRLDRILHQESWHRTGAGWISGAIYGANDGLAAVFGIVAGVSGATGGSTFVLTAGLSGAVASGLSMATGAFLAARSEAEVAAANVAREMREVLDNPDEEREELSLFYQLKGIDEQTANMIAEKISRDPETMLKAQVSEELGGGESGTDPVQSAAAAGISTFVGAMVPVIPFFFLRGTTGVIVAFVVSLIAHFLVGASKSLFTLRRWWSAGLEMTLAGVIVGGITYGIGLLIKAAGA